MKRYYEMHVTFTGQDREVFRDLVQRSKWRYSAIDGDANLGDGVKQYATRQMNARTSVGEATLLVKDMASHLARHGAIILRRKVELVIYDDRSSLVQPCDGTECATCPSNTL